MDWEIKKGGRGREKTSRKRKGGGKPGGIPAVVFALALPRGIFGPPALELSVVLSLFGILGASFQFCCLTSNTWIPIN